MISRRSFIKALIYTTAYLSNGMTSFAHAAYNKSTIFMTDFGGLIKKPVQGVVDDNAKAKSILRNAGKMHPRGTGHSGMGQSMLEEAFIFTPEVAKIKMKDDVVIASAGTTLLEIDNFLEPYGRTLPVSPDHRSLSLGGVLSVGGFDFGSFKRGSLTSHVSFLDLLGHDGRLHKSVQAVERRAAQALGGIGQHDIILCAGIKTVKKPEKTLINDTPLLSSGQYVDMVRKFIEDNHYKNKTGSDKLDVWYATWHGNEGRVVRGQHVYEDTAVNQLLNNNGVVKDDLRAFRKEETDRWVFGRPYKYHIWSDHSVYIDFLEEQLDHALRLKSIAEDMGALSPINSLLVRTGANSKFKQDYMISIGVYANFLEEHSDAANEFSKIQIEYSKESQINREAVPYLAGWYWKSDGTTS